MKQENYKIFVLVLRILVGVFGIVCFIAMFQNQVEYDNGGLGFNTFDLANPGLGFKSVVFPLIGYILFIVAILANVAMIFVKDMLGGSKVNKMIDYVIAGFFLVGGLLVVLSRVWFGMFNNANSTVLAGSPIVACVFAALALATTVVISTKEEKI